MDRVRLAPVGRDAAPCRSSGCSRRSADSSRRTCTAGNTACSSAGCVRRAADAEGIHREDVVRRRVRALGEVHRPARHLGAAGARRLVSPGPLVATPVGAEDEPDAEDEAELVPEPELELEPLEPQELTTNTITTTASAADVVRANFCMHTLRRINTHLADTTYGPPRQLVAGPRTRPHRSCPRREASSAPCIPEAVAASRTAAACRATSPRSGLNVSSTQPDLIALASFQRRSSFSCSQATWT